MSEAMRNRAEIAKLSRLVGRSPDDLDYLRAIPSEDIAQLRDQVTEVLFSPNGSLGRLAAASKLLPVGLVATLAERVFGPVLSARVAGLLEPERAVQMAAKLPTEFLADIAAELDPRRARAVIARIPAERIAAVTRVLVAREEFVTMGRFVGYLDQAAIAAAVKAMDDASMLRIAAVLENPESVRDLIGLLSPGRLEHVIDTAASDGLWPETLELLTHLDDDERRRLIRIATGRDDAALDTLIVAAYDQGLWDIALPLTGLMDPDELQRFAALKSLQVPGVLESIVDAAVLHDELWRNLVPIVAFLPEPCQARVAEHLGGLSVDPAQLMERAREAGVADQLGPLSAVLGA